MSDNDSDYDQVSEGIQDNNKKGGEVPEKPRERYDPPEPSDDQNVIFGSGITSGINFNKYESISVKVTGQNIIKPIESFEECGLRPLVLENLVKSGYTTPTPIQKYSFPSILNKRDLMACAQTGSGKTAAFMVPIVNMLLSDPTDLVVSEECVEPQAVIISPVRELSIQIFNEARKFAHGSMLKCGIAYGGTGVMQQARNLMRGCHILVATPGRINDFVEKGRISFASVRFFVLDEADRMLDMGFLPEVEKLLDHPSMKAVGERQTLMFSATFPDEIQRLAAKFLQDYLFIAVGIIGGACADVEQIIKQVTKFDKKDKLVETLRSYEGEKQLALVFVAQKRTADFIAAYLSENDFPTTSIHGDRLQSQREQALHDFKTGFRPTLVATAVAARGLDIRNVTHVINFDLPQSIDEYVHRIGRTGRVGNSGKATSFYDPATDEPLANDLAKVLRQCGQEVPDFLEGGSGGDTANRGRSGFGRVGGRDFRSNRRPKAQVDEEDGEIIGVPRRIDEVVSTNQEDSEEAW